MYSLHVIVRKKRTYLYCYTYIPYMKLWGIGGHVCTVVYMYFTCNFREKENMSLL